MSWKEKLNFGDDTSIQHEINGRPVAFYPVSYYMLSKLRKTAKPIGRALAILTTGSDKDTGNIFREFGNPYTDEKGQIIKIKGRNGEQTLRDMETIAEAISPDLAITRAEQKAEAADLLLSVFTEPENLEMLAEVILDSLRWEKSERPPAKEFANEVTLPMLSQMIVGVCKANKGVLGPLGEKLGPLFSRAQSLVESKLPPNESEQSNPEQTTNGQPSQTG